MKIESYVRNEKEATALSEVQSCFQRIEKKYLLTYDQYEAMRTGMEKYVKPDAYSHYTICNIYYDTDDFYLIRNSLEKPVYKEKLRVRSYGVPTGTDRVFVELKKKFDGVVYKRRITLPAGEAVRYLSGSPLRQPSQISREIDWFMNHYRPHPAAFIGYDREAFAGRENPDLRVTFDTNLRGRNRELDLRMGSHGDLIIPRDRILMELKIPGSAPLWLAHLLSENGIFASSFSKYGTYYKQLLGAVPSYGKYLKEVRRYA